MKNLNFPVLTGVILALAVLTGSSILAFDAAFLLAVCFAAFLTYFYYNLSDSIVQPLEEQSSAIQKEFEQYYLQYEKMLNSLVTYHQRRVLLAKELRQIADFSKKELSYLVEKRRKSFAQEISHQVTQKLRTLELKDQEIYKDVQNQATSHFTEQVYSFFQKGEDSNYSKDIFVQEAINSIKQIAQKTPENYPISKSTEDKLKTCLMMNSASNIPLSYLIMQSAKNEE